MTNLKSQTDTKAQYPKFQTDQFQTLVFRSLGIVWCLVLGTWCFPASAACTNPSPMPAGYAAPCPVFSVSPASVSQTGTETLSATPQAGTDYIYTTAYYAKGSTWLPVTLTGNNAAPSYSTALATGNLPSVQLSSLSVGTNYLVLWDWLWDATTQCYKGPGLNQCNTGTWRLQTFSLTSSTQGSAVSLSPVSLSFSSQAVGTTSPAQYITVTNIGSSNLIFTAIAAFTGDFNFGGSGTTICSLSTPVTPGNNCTFGVAFTPAVSGTRTGTLAISDTAGGSPQVITLSGTGSASTYIYSQSTYTSTNCSTNCFYISPSGSDSNAGTSAGAPWKTFAHAVPLLTAGSTLNLMNGAYTSAANGKFFADCSGTAHNGTSNSPVTIKALSERQAWIKGDGSQDSFTVNNCSYWQIIGIHASSADNNVGNTWTGYPFTFTNFQHGVVRRNIADHTNRFGNVHAMQFHQSSNNLIEENEVYYFHRHGLISGGDGVNNEIRRNYANSRNYFASAPSGAYPADVEYGISVYTSNSNLLENNISENVAGATFPSAGFDNENTASNNTFLGNVAAPNLNYGFRIGPHSGQAQPTGILYINNVVVKPGFVGFWNRGGKATYSIDSAFGTASTRSGLLQSDIGDQSYGTYQFIVNNSTAQGASAATGFAVANISGNTFNFDHNNSFNNGTAYSPNQNVTNPNSSNPAFGSCYLWVPASSPLKGAGSNGSDIGANILYAYQGGVLTGAKLWNTDGSFVGKGAIVPGLNDVAGSSLFDIQNRLNVNKNGCAFPAGY